MIEKQFLTNYKKIIRDKVKKKEPIYVLKKATKRLITFEYLIIYPFVFITCLLIRLIRPLFFIRFGSLHSEKMGPLSALPELNLCEQEHGIQPKGTFDIYTLGSSSLFTCNSQLSTMWQRVLRVYPRSRYFWKVMNIFSFGKDHIIKTPEEFSEAIKDSILYSDRYSKERKEFLSKIYYNLDGQATNRAVEAVLDFAESQGLK